MCRGLGMRRKSVHLHSDTSTPIRPIKCHTHITHLLKSLKKTSRFDKPSRKSVVSRAFPTHARSFPSARSSCDLRTADERKREDAQADALRLRDLEKAQSSQVLVPVRTVRQTSTQHQSNRLPSRHQSRTRSPNSRRQRPPRKTIKTRSFKRSFKRVKKDRVPRRQVTAL